MFVFVDGGGEERNGLVTIIGGGEGDGDGNGNGEGDRERGKNNSSLDITSSSPEPPLSPLLSSSSYTYLAILARRDSGE